MLYNAIDFEKGKEKEQPLKAHVNKHNRPRQPKSVV
jgi:hypothetical protein